MSWRETAPSRYERPFDTIERLHRNMANSGAHLDKQHSLVSSAVQLTQPPSAMNLRHAWKALRHRHPQIAACPDDNGANFTTWTPSSCPPTNSFLLYYLPHSRELLFRSPHWRTDGRGMLLQHDFFTILATGPESDPTPLCDGSETSRLPAPLDDAAGLSQTITPAIDDASSAALSSLFSGPTPASIRAPPPTSTTSTTPQTSRRFTLQLPPDLSTAIILARKARKQTATTTAHAALLTTLRKHAPISGRFICFTPFDLRTHLPSPSPMEQRPWGLCHPPYRKTMQC
ncbi:uncharacterized protein KD926_005893 [Aspergillus affinis]|uniref:uncharacterized protein n=1 Tax=Aspergillus affinis TaxID=1070780 RepID=UPI0022FF1C1D|nr:uncharacterized protein KD926_005893 [Aspergillus affinis]KAI9045949.1 hypothetical protein KD926_005893 [Aspergillus affinis]